jgi:hypothetical protein
MAIFPNPGRTWTKGAAVDSLRDADAHCSLNEIPIKMSDDLLPDLLTAVEQQLTSPQTPYVAKTLARLLKLGLEEQEAKTQIALCLGEEMDNLLRTRKPFNEEAYRASLDALPDPNEDDDK